MGVRGGIDFGYIELGLLKVAVDLALGADDVNTAQGGGGTAHHIVGAGGAAGELYHHALVVHYIVVALVNAATVRGVTLEQMDLVFNGGVLNALQLVPHIEGPAVRVVNVQPFARVAAGIYQRAVYHTPRAGVCRGVLRLKLELAAKGANRGGLGLCHHPHHNVQIVAALGQQHTGVALLTIGPLAPHIRGA